MQGRNDTYVTLVEASLARALHEPEKGRHGLDTATVRRLPGIAPPHFYRELARTAEGCRLLRDKGHFGDFVETIRDHGMESDDAETIVKVKGCLWAVGNVGSMDLGAPFIEESNIVEPILHIAERSEVLSMRGTAFSCSVSFPGVYTDRRFSVIRAGTVRRRPWANRAAGIFRLT